VTAVPLENILPTGRRRRVVQGIVLIALAAATAGGLVGAGASALWGGLLVLLVWLAALMLVQARDRT